MLGKILLIDDEAGIRQAFRGYLEDLDFDICEAENGELGLRVFDEQRPDLVLLDLRMPVMNGLDVARELVKRSPGTPLVVVSGTGVIEDVVEALRIGAWDYLLKPVADMQVLVHAISNALERARLRQREDQFQEELLRQVKQRTQQLLEANERLELAGIAFETNDAILIADENGLIERVNQAFTRLTGYSEQEVVGRNPRLLKSGRHDLNFYRSFWRELLDKGHWEGQMWNRRRDGSIYPARQSITVVPDNNGKPKHFVAISTDQSRIVAQQEALERHANEQQALGALLELSLQHRMTSEQDYLQSFLEALLWQVPWLGVQHQGGIFKVSELAPDQLELVANVGLSEPISKACRFVAFGHCLCGRVARDARSLFVSNVDQDHDTHHPGMPEHGHYVVPVLDEEQVIAVMVFYLPGGYESRPEELHFLERVAHVLAMGIGRFRSEQRLLHNALHDALTGLPNRRLMNERLEAELVRIGQGGGAAFALIDLDGFQHINDALGHRVGDELLRAVGERFHGQITKRELLARTGGDEFALLVGGCDDNEKAIERARKVLDKLRSALQLPLELEHHSLRVSFSAGISCFQCERCSADDLFGWADTALFEAKRSGRNTDRVYRDELRERHSRRVQIENDLRESIGSDQFHLAYQPQVDARGRVLGAEALLRWIHPERGFVSPVDFIPVAEDSGQMIVLGDWVFESACRALRKWLDDGLPDSFRHLSVNISPRQFYGPEFVRSLLDVTARLQVPRDRLMLEITEGVLIEDVDGAIDRMSTLRAEGFRFSIDDFGTGYSSMSYLKQLPIDELKIDKSFVDDIGPEAEANVIVQSMIAMGRCFGLQLVAEGVETVEQVQLLEVMGGVLYQGYYFHRPLPQAELEPLLFAPTDGG